MSSLTLLAFASHALAAPGEADPSFNVEVDSWVYAVAVQADGKILIGGTFTNVSGVLRYGIARLNADGSLDGGFDAGFIAGKTNCIGFYKTNCSIGRSIRSVVVQPDGKILIGGEFLSVAGVNHSGIARLNVDGSVDGSFDPGTGISSDGPPSRSASVGAMAIQADGKLLIVGDFAFVDGTARAGMARLNVDGTLDETLFGVGGTSVVVQSDGKIVAGCSFGTVDGLYMNIVRFNPDGGVDTNFDERGIYFDVAAMAVQADGKIVVGAGMVASYNGQPCGPIGRLHADGVVDGSFSNRVNGVVNSIVVQRDGRILVAGGFTQINGVNRHRIARFGADGNLDQSFATAGLGGSCNPFCPQALALAVQADGKVLVGGSFTTVDGAPRKFLARLFGDELPRLTALTTLSDGRVELVGSAATNAHLRLESSANLLNWSQVAEFVNTNGVFHFTDTTMTDFPSRFYRAVWLP